MRKRRRSERDDEKGLVGQGMSEFRRRLRMEIRCSEQADMS